MMEESTNVLDDDADHADWRDYEDRVRELCASKAADFRLLGYEDVSADDIWQCALRMLKGKPRLHQVVQAILGMQAGQFMNFMTMNAFKGLIDGTPFDAGNRG